MPPEQCPACGRFLKRSLVDGLATAPEPCPKCGRELTAAMFEVGTVGEAVASGAPAGASVGSAGLAPSVRPPDLPPDDVRDRPDPLAGWDAGVPDGLVAVRDERPFPVDTVAVAGAAAVGAIVGAIVGRRAIRDAVLGALGGAIGAGVSRRIWELP